ncbi:MAG: ornithine cyclodeaminase [Pseudomonadota bacterium]
MRYISFQEADSLLSWTMIADALQEGHKLPKAEIGDLLLQQPPNALLSRGAWIPGLGMALKSMSVFPDNTRLDPPLPSIHGGVLLFDDDVGHLISVIDGILVTKWKTAGDSVLGARLLANPNPKTHLMVGAGTVAASIIDAYHEVFPTIERFMIWNRTPEKANRLAEEKTSANLSIEVVPQLADACAEADIITAATMSVDPILQGQHIKPGTHVDLIGAFKPNMREADDALISKATLFVDSRDTTIGHIGEIEIPLKNGIISQTDLLGDLYDLCGDRTGRKTEDEVTLFKNGGGAHLDLMTSRKIFQAVTP